MAIEKGGKCVICGLELSWVPGSDPAVGGYVHLMKNDSDKQLVADWHFPKVRKDLSVTGDRRRLFVEKVASTRDAVPRASVNPICPFCGRSDCQENQILFHHLNFSGKANL